MLAIASFALPAGLNQHKTPINFFIQVEMSSGSMGSWQGFEVKIFYNTERIWL